MSTSVDNKKRLIVSFKNLSEELLEKFRDTYPDGYRAYMQRIVKPNGEPMFLVPLETEDTHYMVKFDVKIDTAVSDDDMDDILYGVPDEKDDDGFEVLRDDIDKDEEDNSNHTERVLNYGDSEDSYDENSNMDMADGEDDDFEDGEDAEGEDPAEIAHHRRDDDLEPTAEDLMDIDAAQLLSDAGLDMPADTGKGKSRTAARKTVVAGKVKLSKPAKKNVVPSKATAKPAAKKAMPKTKVESKTAAPKKVAVKKPVAVKKAEPAKKITASEQKKTTAKKPVATVKKVATTAKKNVSTVNKTAAVSAKKPAVTAKKPATKKK